MAEHVVPLDVLTDWDPHDPEGVLLSDETRTTVLALNPHQDDPDRRCVALVWRGTHSVFVSQDVSGHRLADHGLQDVLGVGVVRDSGLAGNGARAADLVHHLVLMTDRVVEVVAQLLTVERVPGTTAQAATAALTRRMDSSAASGP